VTKEPLGPGSTPVVLIIGASSGIGLAAALRFAARGAQLVLVARSRDALNTASEQCRTRGASRVDVVVADMNHSEDIAGAVALAMQTHGRIDVVVLSATVMAYGTIEVMPFEVLQQVVDTAVHGTLHVVQSVMPIFRRQRRGTLIVVNSLLGSVTVPRMGAYATAKWGQRALVRTLQQEVRDEPGINVCLVSPGAVNTPIYQQAGNYVGQSARPPWPVLSPEHLGAAVVRLADHPRGATSFLVGPGNPLIIMGFRLAPFIYDRIVGPLFTLAGLTRDRVEPTPGNVFAAVPELEQQHGEWPSSSAG
jgi:NAD(P)-dependent dehydrogenase (short-subunit alcohol dehydrogenase family)